MRFIYAGVMHALIFPKFNLTIFSALFLLPLLLPLLGAGSRPGLKRPFLSFFLAGTLSGLITLYWIFPVLYLNGAGVPASAAGLAALAAYTGVYWGLFGSGVKLVSALKPWLLIFFIPALWVSLEYLRAHLLTGFPWLLAGYSLWKTPVMIQAASYTGVYGLSFFIILVNASLAVFIKKKKPVFLLPAVLVAAVLLAYGLAWNEEEKGLGDPVRVSLLQGNISQYMKWDSEYEDNILETYRRLSFEAAAESAEIIVWPETSLPGTLEDSIRLTGYVRSIAEGTKAYSVIGSVERSRGKYYNSAYAVSPGGGISAPYRKMHLTPFGEYIPMRGVLSLFIDVINEIGDFHPGLETVMLEAAGISLGPAICFESVFPHRARRLFMNGAEVYVNITNDGWFLNTAGPYQHFIHSVFRAVENRAYAVRAANTGISAVITPGGRILESSALLEETVLTRDVRPARARSFYSRFGDMFAFFCLLFSVSAISWRIKNVSGI